MKIFCLIFLAVGSLGEKDGVSYPEVYKDLEKVLIGNNGEFILRNYGNLPIFGYGAPYKGKGLDEKYIRLFGRRYEEYRGREKYNYRIDDGNPDFHGRIIRPCQVYDTFCIRKFFAEHSHCKISGRQVPEPLYRAQFTVNYPSVNMSATSNNLQYTGLKDGRVEEFYINKATDNLVITIFFPSVTTFSNDVSLKFYLRGREPVLTRGFGGSNSLSYSVTVVIPRIDDLKLEKAEITTYINGPVVPFAVGSGLGESTDPEVLLMYAAFLANEPLDQTEAALTEGNFYASTFIQYNICDFGLKVL